MYESYTQFVSEVCKKNLAEVNFKSDVSYTGILEHVTYEQGMEYISCIKRDFPVISFEHITESVFINDKFGIPKQYTFMFNNKPITCSPTSLRYIYHALVILKHYRESNHQNDMVEIGCGYGGLFLSICYFSKLLNIHIHHYSFIDLPEICELIQKYVSMHEDIQIDYSVHSALEYGKDIDANNLFLISNYCFTEISDEHRHNYLCHLFPKVKNGFILWQTIFGLPIGNVNILKKDSITLKEESPQTATTQFKNYFVYF